MSMQWKEFFSQPILIRGKDYFYRDKVTSLISYGNLYKATVLGSRLYNVTVEQRNGKLFHANCDCPHSQSGYYCKHIAAVLYAIEEFEEYESIGEVHPFDEMYKDFDDDRYVYFDMRRMTKNIAIFEDTYNKAVRLLNGRKIVDVSLHFCFPTDGDNSGMVCEMRGSLKEDFDSHLMLTFDRDGLVDSSCGKFLPGFGMTGRRQHGDRLELNEYLVALMLLGGKQLLSEPNAGDSTSGRGMKLLEAFRAERASELPSDLRREIHLEPRLLKEDGRYYLTLRAGESKCYVVKDIADLVNCVEQKKGCTIGKTEYHFSRDRISENDSRLYGFIRNVTEDAVYRADSARELSYIFRQSASEVIKNKIGLYGSRLDQLFDAVEGMELSLTDSDGSKKTTSLVRCCVASPEISLDIHKDVDGGVFHGVTATGRAPEFLHGSEHHYFIDAGRFCRVPPETENRLAPLLGLLTGGEFSFNVGRNNIAEFSYSVLPKLRDIVEVREFDSEEIAAHMPPCAEPVFYLDNENGVLSCRATVRYGEEEYSLGGGTNALRPGSGRDSQREEETLAVVREYFAGYDHSSGVFLCEQSDEAAYRLLSEGVGELLKVGEVNCTDSFRALNIRRRIPVRVGVSISGDLMDLSIESDDIPLRELADILKSYRRKKRFHRLKNGDFVDVDQTISELGDMVDTMRLSTAELASGSVKLPLFRALYLDRMSERCEALAVSRDARFKKIIREFKTVSESDFEIPAHLRDVMRNYQVFGYRWLRTLEKYGFGGILADDMGLGKTLQVISAMCAAKEESSAGTSLVVCPASLIYNWLEELRRFAPGLSAVAVAGNQSERRDIIEKIGQYDVAVTSYDLLKRDAALYEKIRFNYEIIDEAQYIKNHSTAAAKAVKVINARVRFALTGTPIENRLSELWSIFDYLMPGYLYGYETFRKELETPIARNANPQATEKLRRMTSPFILRRLKSDVLKDLPDKIEEVRYAAFDTSQRRLYDAQVAHMKGMLTESDGAQVKKNKLQILSELTRLRQICCDPSLLFEDYAGGSAKREVCIDLIRSAIEGEHKILLFSQFTSMLELLEKDLAAEGISYCKITGATPKQERLDLVQKFNGDNTPVFLISLKAGGTGLNLTGADVVIHYDPWWNLAAQNQATDRAHRIGQSKIVSVYRLIAKHSVEEKILELQASKQNLADEILSGELGTIGSMSREELLALLG